MAVRLYLGAVKSIETRAKARGVPPVLPSPLALEASADYSAYIYDTQAAGRWQLHQWLNAPHDANSCLHTSQEVEFRVIRASATW